MQSRQQSISSAPGLSRTLLVALVVAGLVLGVLVSWARANFTDDTLARQEYIAEVAALYGREQIITNAQERLALLGEPDLAAVVDEVATSFADQRRDRPTTATELRNLADALKTAPPIAPTASSTAAPPGATAPSDEEPDASGMTWQTIALIAVLAVVMIAVALIAFTRFRAGRRRAASLRQSAGVVGVSRQAARPISWQRLADDDPEEDKLSGIVSAPRPLAGDRPVSPRADAKPQTDLGGSRDKSASYGVKPAGSSLPYTTGNVSEPRPYITPTPPPPRLDPVQPESSTPSHGQGSRQSPSGSSGWSRPTGRTVSQPTMPTIPPPVRSRTPSWSSEPRAASMVFDCQFRPEDEPYDEIHRIVDPLTKAVIGACGMSSAGRLPGKASGCYSFILWLQDYTSDDEVACVGLISKWAESTKAQDVREWARHERLGRVIAASDGGKIVLETTGLRANANVITFDYVDAPSMPRYGCFRSLHVRFHVMSLR